MANVALSVLDQHYARAWEAMGQKWHQRDAIRRRGRATYRLIRYADDFVICVSGERRHAEQLIAETEQVIAPLGLSLSKEKTRVVHIDEGIDFLGWRIKRQRRGSDGRWFVYTGCPSRCSRWDATLPSGSEAANNGRAPRLRARSRTSSPTWYP